MEQAKSYLAVLAKVMQEKATKNNEGKDTYNELYKIINSEFKYTLQKSLFPNAPEIVGQLDELTDSMEALFSCPEIIGKACASITNYGTNKIFEQVAAFFMHGQFVSKIYNIFSQIPLVIVHSGQDGIEAINYANERITLTVDEYKLLVIESNRRKIALNKIVRFFVIKTELRAENICLISDNIYMAAGKLFERALNCRVLYLNQQGIDRAETKYLHVYDALVIDENNLEAARKDKRFAHQTIIKSGDLTETLLSERTPLLYGYLEHYKAIEAEILSYYSEQYGRIRRMLREVLGDIVRLGQNRNENETFLKKIRSSQEEKKERLEKEKKEIEIVLSRIEELIVKISRELDNTLTEKRHITAKVYDYVFKTLFFYGGDTQTAQYVLSKLKVFGYQDMDLVTLYIKSLSGQVEDKCIYDVKQGEWSKAKMILQVCDLQKIPKSQLENCLKVLGNKISTGKEFYAKALVSIEIRKQVAYFIESFDRGYEQAGYALLNFYKEGYKKINIMSLANALVPEACMILAEQDTKTRRKHNHYVGLDDPDFVYYKLAAAKQFAPAIGAIVDAVYESRFSSAHRYQRLSQNDMRNKDALENGYAICQLCRYLIERMYHTQHYSEVLGVVLFCLNTAPSEAMSLLSNSNSPVSYYCRGRMYQLGNGVSKDLEKALSFYERAQSLGWKSDYFARLKENCEQELKRKKERERSEEQYQSTESYKPIYRTTDSYSDDGCFISDTKILMGDYTYKNVEDLSIGDLVIVYDHYNGKLSKEIIVANVHDKSCKRSWDIIKLKFTKGKDLDIVHAHGLYDLTLNRYVLINVASVKGLIGHEFVTVIDNCLEKVELLSYSIRNETCCYYAPVSKTHLNVIADDFLTIPPTPLTINLLPLNAEMKYDFSFINKFEITPYEKLKNFIIPKEYNELPCKYFDAILAYNSEIDIKGFAKIMNLYRS